MPRVGPFTVGVTRPGETPEARGARLYRELSVQADARVAQRILESLAECRVSRSFFVFLWEQIFEISFFLCFRSLRWDWVMECLVRELIRRR